MRFPTLTVALVLSATPLFADLLEPANVDARAKVLIHLDVQALAKTRLFRLLREDPDLGIERALGDFEEEVGLDLLADVRSATVYLNDVEGHWVALLRTGERIDAALAALAERPGYSASVVDGRTVHALREHGNEWFGLLYRAETGGERLFVITEDVGALVAAIEVVDGKRPSLGSAAADADVVEHVPQPGSVLFVSADRGLGDLGDFRPSAEISRLVTGVRFDCGESDDTLFANLSLDAATERDAKDVHDVIQGGLAFTSLISGRADETRVLGDLVDALDVRRERTVVTFAFRYSSQALYDGFVSLKGLEGR
jgi:hypothetical protein